MHAENLHAKKDGWHVGKRQYFEEVPYRRACVVDKNKKQQAQPLTYNQLRARLPRSIGDDIVRLLADNYDALGDFASIQTQADVDNFNLKYQVNLVLPQEA